MSSKPVPDLPPADPLTGTELVHVVQNGSSRRSTVAAVATGAGGGYNYGSFAPASIGASEILMDHIAAVPHTLPVNFVGSVASVGTNPTANPWVADVRKNGVSVGSLSITSAGACTFTTSAGAVAMVAGDVLTVIAPALIDASIARLRFTFRGTI